MIVLRIIFLILGLILFVLFIRELVLEIERKKNLIDFIKSRFFKYFISILLIILIPLVYVFNYIEEPELNTLQEKIEFSEKYEHYLDQNWIYSRLTERYPDSLEIHFQYVNTLRKYIELQTNNHSFNLNNFKKYYECERLEEYYTNIINSTDDTLKDKAYLFFAIHKLNLNETDSAYYLLKQIKDSSIQYHDYAFGYFYRKTRIPANYKFAVNYLLSSVKKKEAVEQAYKELAIHYYYFSQKDELKQLVYNDSTGKYIHPYFVRIVHLRSKSFIKYWSTVFASSFKNVNLWGFLASLFILLTWLFYLRQVDIYEHEKWIHLILTLFLSFITIWFLIPMNDLIWDNLIFYTSDPIEEFFHITFFVGVFEEFVKIIPIFILLRFTKAINEPFDYILYCSISAIGFAFIENLGYIQAGSLYNINARALTATVAHMIFSSTIGYGLMLAKYGKFRSNFVLFLLFFSIASLMHGFYDFWLITDWSDKYEWISILFYITGIHIWFLYANNTLNISTFYDKNVLIKNDRLKYYLIISLTGIFMFSFFVTSYTQGLEYGNAVFLSQILTYGFLILYLSFSLSRFSIVRGYLAPFTVNSKFILPRISRISDFKGLPVLLSAAKNYNLVPAYNFLRAQLPKKGYLGERIVVDGNLESYLFIPDETLEIEGHLGNKLVIYPKKKNLSLSKNGNILVFLLLIPEDLDLSSPLFGFEDFTNAGWAVSKRIPE